MQMVIACIQELQRKVAEYRRERLNEAQTKAVFVEPMLEALGWDIRDPREVERERPTIDGKSVDYALKINGKPVLFVEAKPLEDSLGDVKAITQVVGYAANDGVDWCVLTNGTTYRVYYSRQKAAAPEKLLYEVSIAPRDSEGKAVSELASLLGRLSRASMADNTLDEIGEQIFTKAKVRKALDSLFANPPTSLIRLLRGTMGDSTASPSQIKAALASLWAPTTHPESGVELERPSTKSPIPTPTLEAAAYDENWHLGGRPRETVELFWALDKFCRELDIQVVDRKYQKKYVSYARDGAIFCCVHVQKGGLRVWLKLDYNGVENPPDFARDVSRIGHWGVGDVELDMNSMSQLQVASHIVQASFQKAAVSKRRRVR